ncbi:MAG: phospho-N-acetylmuramoyl-pentapeptide-transferase [Christensenellales bacterium]
MLIKIGIAVLCSMAAAGILCPLVFRFAKAKHIEQPILHYVDNHSKKAGTPTMGGLIFIIASIAVTLTFFTKMYSIASVSVAATFCFSLIGFLDDYIKVRYKKNMGLRPYQKIIAQIAFAVLLAFFAYRSPLIGGNLRIPFTDMTVDIGGWSVPLYTLGFLAIVNSVNLTDGLDGLAATTGIATVTFFVILTVLSSELTTDYLIKEEYSMLAVFGSSVIGALTVFLVANCFPAKIFMGDTGSLGLGGCIGCLSTFTQNILYLPLVGIVYLFSSLSVILQVASFKLRGKRIFLMAPFHHHLERKGIHENKIVSIYTLVTVAIAVVCIIGY